MNQNERVCLPCAVGYHHECWFPTETMECHCVEDYTSVGPTEPLGDLPTPPPATEKKERGGQIKNAADVGDLQSTGRKRAAKLFPIPKEGEPGYPMACEWRELKNAGGGVEPIVGCMDGVATNIHHGPDKNTLSNFLGNLHRICATCHNRWHTKNDRYYDNIRPRGDEPYLPRIPYIHHQHDYVTKATPEELARNEIAWLRK